jgi:cytochrome c oxidase subunit II
LELITLPSLRSHSPGAIVDTQGQYGQVATVYGAIAIAVFVLVLLLTVVIVLRYRARADGKAPSRVNDAPKFETLYVSVLGAIAAFLVAFTFIHESKSDAALTTRSGLVIRVTGAKWHWSFFYPRYGVSELGTDSSPPTLYVPRDQNVEFRLTSVDVIHAFWIPVTDFKRAAYPGYVQSFVLSFDKAGFIRNAGECAEFCGLLHAEMRFNLDVMNPDQFARWIAAHRRTA